MNKFHQFSKRVTEGSLEILDILYESEGTGSNSKIFLSCESLPYPSRDVWK